MSILRKGLDIQSAELKFDDARKGFFSGYASVFGGVDAYGDTIVKGAYSKTLANRQRPVHLRWNHYGPIIGKWTALEEDDRGLRVEGELTPGHSVAEDVYALIKHGAVSGLSIGYRPIKQTATGDDTRTLEEIELIEISVVESPADLAAVIGDVKSVIDKAESLKEIERLLRDAAGFSRADATALVARVKSLAHGEREAEEDAAKLVAAINELTKRIG